MIFPRLKQANQYEGEAKSEIRKRPSRRARTPRQGLIEMPEPDRMEAAAAATCGGSPEHKLPSARSDASLCPPELKGPQATRTERVGSPIRAGRIGGPIEGRFPRYVWRRVNLRWFAGRLTNQRSGPYKGYPVAMDEVPPELVGSEGGNGGRRGGR